MSKKQKTLFETWNKNAPSTSYATGCNNFQLEETPKRKETNLFSSIYSPANHNVFQTPPISRKESRLDANGFDPEAGKTWIYPTNYPVRDYQFSIVNEALFKNTLVILPTGLGKTFIAAVVMYNIYRWYPKGKVIFMAPTRPLVAQQIDACFKITGISREDTTQMTGTNVPEERKRLWMRKRVFFLTPQVLSNDIVRDICPAASIKCVVVDEAHKALGNHAYCQVIRELQSYTTQFRILALTATPGSDTQAVKLVLSNLLISHVEMRSEDSDDVKQYTHIRDIEKIVVPLGDRLTSIKSRFLDVINIYLKRLTQRKVMSFKNPALLTKFQVLKMRDDFSQHPPDRIDKLSYGLAMADFSLCISLYHAFELLLLHGARPFYNFLTGILNGEKSIPHARAELLKNYEFEQLMTEVQDNYIPGHDGKEEINSVKHNKRISPGHPKLEKLLEVVLNHFKSGNNDIEKNTRVMIFSQYRDSVQEIVDMLNLHQPMIKCMSFIGQASKLGSSVGYSQKHQLKVLEQFRSGGYNTLVSTCVGEEGLDIGEVDLIVCYDCPKSPIRLVQRMGRTGRLRKGRIIILIAEGKEESMYYSCERKKKSVHRAITKGFSFAQIYHKSPSLIPNGTLPVCVKSVIIPDFSKGAIQLKEKSSTSAFLTPEELIEYNMLYKVPSCETPLLPSSTFFTLKSAENIQTDGAASNRDASSESIFSLSKWMLWQTRPQRIHKVTHSSKTLLLTSTVEQINFHVDASLNGLSETLEVMLDVPTKVCPSPPIIDLCTEDEDLFSFVDDENQPFDCTVEDNAINTSFQTCDLNVVTPVPNKCAEPIFTDQKHPLDAEKLLPRLFNIKSIKPIAEAKKYDLRSPPILTDMLPTKNNTAFEMKPLGLKDDKVVSALRILNKKMKAQLKRKVRELGANLSFTFLNKHLSMSSTPAVRTKPAKSLGIQSFDPLTNCKADSVRLCTNCKDQSFDPLTNCKADSDCKHNQTSPSENSFFKCDSVPVTTITDKISIVPPIDISSSSPQIHSMTDPAQCSPSSAVEALEFDISFDIFQTSIQFEEELGNIDPLKHASAIGLPNQVCSPSNVADKINESNISNDSNVSSILDQLSSTHKRLPDPAETSFALPLKVKKVVFEKDYKSTPQRSKEIPAQDRTKNLPNSNNLCSNSKGTKGLDESVLERRNSKHISPDHVLQSKSGKCEIDGGSPYSWRNNKINGDATQFSLTQMLSFIECTEKFETLKGKEDSHAAKELLDEALICESSDEEIEPTPPKEKTSEFLYRINSLNQDSNSLQAWNVEDREDDYLGEKFSFDLSDIHYPSDIKNAEVPNIGNENNVSKEPNVSPDCFKTEAPNVIVNEGDVNKCSGVPPDCFKTEAPNIVNESDIDREQELSPDCFDKLFFDISFDVPNENGGCAQNDTRLSNTEENNKSLHWSAVEKDTVKTPDDKLPDHGKVVDPSLVSELQSTRGLKSQSTPSKQSFNPVQCLDSKNNTFEEDKKSVAISDLENSWNSSVSHKVNNKETCLKKLSSLSHNRSGMDDASSKLTNDFENSSGLHHSTEKSKIGNTEPSVETTTSYNSQKSFTFKKPTSSKLSIRKRVDANKDPVISNYPSCSKTPFSKAVKADTQKWDNSKTSLSKQPSYCQEEMDDFDVKKVKWQSTLSRKGEIFNNNENSREERSKVKNTGVAHRKHGLKPKSDFILSQADVSGSEEDYESHEEEEDDFDESFIDDVSIKRDSLDQRGMYLQSIKNCVGLPQKFKLKMNYNESFPTLQEEDCSNYLLDSFCVNDNEVVFSSSEEETFVESKVARSKSVGKKRMRIVTADDSSSSDNDLCVAKIPKKCQNNPRLLDSDSKKRMRIMTADDYSSSEDDIHVTKISKSIQNTTMPLLDNKQKRKAKFVISSDEDENRDENMVTSGHCEGDAFKHKPKEQKCLEVTEFESSTSILDLKSNSSRNCEADMVEQEDNLDLNFSFDINWEDDIPTAQHSNSYLSKVPAGTSKTNHGDIGLSVSAYELPKTNCNVGITPTRIENITSTKSKSNFQLPISLTDKNVIRSNVAHTSKNAGNAADDYKSSLHTEVSDRTLSPSCSTLCNPDNLTILVDSRELAGGKPIISCLRNKYGIKPVVMQLMTSDYILSNRLAVERIMDTEFLATGMPPKVVDKVKYMCEAYEKTFVIIQADCRKRVLGFNKLSTKYLQFSLNLNFHPSAKVLFSNSFDETSAILFDMIQKEKVKGFLIDVPVVLNPMNQRLFDFYLSCPHVTPVCALRFVYHFPMVSMFFKSSVQEVKKAGSISTRKAISVCEYLKSEMLFDAFS